MDHLTSLIRRFPILTTLTLLAGLVGCTTAPTAPAPRLDRWVYGDLRGLDPLDAPEAGRELIAAYTRTTTYDLQIRLDFLDLTSTPTYDLYLALDTRPGGSPTLPLAADSAIHWDLLLVVPAHGVPQALQPDLQPRADLIPRVVRDPTMDDVVISLNRARLPETDHGFRFEVLLTRAGERLVVDRLGPLRSDDAPPPAAPLLLAFWDSFPAFSPAQALRRWDGAHTGPFGSRHGLHNLISQAARHGIPITLLDLKNPASLSALDYLGVLPEVREASNGGRLILPGALTLPHTAASGVMPFSPPQEALAQGIVRSRQAATAFELPASQVLYAPLVPERVPPQYRLIVLPPTPGDETLIPGPVTVLRWQDRLLLPLPRPADELQATPEGLALPYRQALLQFAFDPAALGRPGGASLMVLGGSLPDTAWGSPGAARQTLAYIASHPWIQPVGAADLLTAHPAGARQPPEPTPPPAYVPGSSRGTPLASGLSAQELQSRLVSRLVNTPDGVIKNLAWEAYFALLTPNPPGGQNLNHLRAGFLGNIGHLLAAATWADHPGEIATCSTDPDLDGVPECVLANERLFTLFEVDGARLVVAFWMTHTGPQQVIAPYAQFTIGLGDPATWDPALGPAGDPALVPGAFSDSSGRWEPYQPTLLPQGLTFTSLDGRRSKTFTLTPDGLHASYRGPQDQTISVQIPLALAPQRRFMPGWAARYHTEQHPGLLVWKVDGGPLAAIATGASAQITAFNQGYGQLAFPEDPNFDYPPGHYQPFPFALVEVEGSGAFEIELRLGSTESGTP